VNAWTAVNTGSTPTGKTWSVLRRAIVVASTSSLLVAGISPAVAVDESTSGDSSAGATDVVSTLRWAQDAAADTQAEPANDDSADCRAEDVAVLGEGQIASGAGGDVDAVAVAVAFSGYRVDEDLDVAVTALDDAARFCGSGDRWVGPDHDFDWSVVGGGLSFIVGGVFAGVG
jgi:hypothetical protein